MKPCDCSNTDEHPQCGYCGRYLRLYREPAWHRGAKHVCQECKVKVETAHRKPAKLPLPSQEDTQPQWPKRGNRWQQTKKHEDRIAKKMGGYRLPGSGNIPLSEWNRNFQTSRFMGQKVSGRVRTIGADVANDRFMIEHKRTTAKGYRVTRKTLGGIVDAARSRSKMPLLVVTYEGERKPDWAMLPLDDLQEILNEIEELRDSQQSQES